MAFATTRDGPFQIYVVDPDGSNPTSVSGDIGINVDDVRAVWRLRP
ncbi:MAG: hypothetical protein ACOC8B_06120 [Gemmatimonadota bacterium]